MSKDVTSSTPVAAAAADGALDLRVMTSTEAQEPAEVTQPTSGNSGVGRAPRPRLRNSDGARCTATTAAGGPCPVRPMMGTNPPMCRMHRAQVDPQLRERLRVERVLGGKMATLRRLPPNFPQPDFSTRTGIRQMLEASTSAVLAGEISASQAQAVTGLVGASLRLAELELEAMLKALEEKLAGGGA